MDLNTTHFVNKKKKRIGVGFGCVGFLGVFWFCFWVGVFFGGDCCFVLVFFLSKKDKNLCLKTLIISKLFRKVRERPSHEHHILPHVSGVLLEGRKGVSASVGGNLSVRMSSVPGEHSPGAEPGYHLMNSINPQDYKEGMWFNLICHCVLG